MQIHFSWLEVVVIAGLLLMALGPERLLEVWADFRKLLGDIRGVFRRTKA